MKIQGQVRLAAKSGCQPWGRGDDPRKCGVIEGVLYDVLRIDVHSFHTRLTLHGIEGEFNSVYFEWADEQPFADALKAYWERYNKTGKRTI